MNSNAFLDQNKQVVEGIIERYKNEFSLLREDILKKRPAVNKWSAVECLDHVNLANLGYLTQFEKTLLNSAFKPSKPDYTAGLLGSLFTKMMRPDKKSRIKWKMKTMNSMIPDPANLNVRQVIETFEQQNLQLLNIIERARQINISKPRIITALGSHVKFKFGDALSFIIAHSERHTFQAHNTIKALKHVDAAGTP